MARINIEDSLFSDGRFIILEKMVGEEMAIGKLVVAWKTAQSYWLQDQLIPHRFWELLKLDELLEVGFAEKRDDGVYMCGTEEHFDWIKQKQEAGRKSGQTRRDKKNERESNTASIPFEQNVNEKGTEVDSRSNETATKKEPLPLPLSPPPSLSQKNNNIPDFDIGELYSAYPRKEGKKKGLANFKRKVKSKKEFERARQAIQNYIKLNETKDRKYLKYFDTFSNCWEDYCEIEAFEAGANSIQYQEMWARLAQKYEESA